MSSDPTEKTLKPSDFEPATESFPCPVCKEPCGMLRMMRSMQCEPVSASLCSITLGGFVCCSDLVIRGEQQ